MTARPPLALTMGEPAGVGPEIIARAWTALKGGDGPAFVVVGDAALMRTQGVPVQTVTAPSDAAAVFGRALGAPRRRRWLGGCGHRQPDPAGGDGPA